MAISLAFLSRDKRLVKAEEESIMKSATVPTTLSSLNSSYNWTTDGDVIIKGSFKSFVYASSSTNPVDMQVDLNEDAKKV